MKICIVGAGSVGGLIGAHFARAGHTVSLVARGAHLAAIAAKGLTLRKPGETFTVRCAAAENPADLGAQDLVFVTLKAHSIAPMLPRLGPLLRDGTVVVPAINGIPWWYFYKEGGRFDGSPVRALDPDGAMLAAIDPGRILGCVVMPAAFVAEPGVVEQTSAATEFVLGEPDRSRSPRVAGLAETMTASGMKTEVSANIRAVVWTKLLGNLAFNPISALVLARMAEMMAQPPLVQLAARLMREAMDVAAAYGIDFPVTIEQRLETARKLGNNRPSMLQDLEHGRPMEVEGIVGAAVEFAARVGVAVPTIETVYALLKARDAALRAGKG